MNDQFFNRELSWLAFNDRVFAEAANASNPLLERLRFATIVASNLDEFFMVRVAGLKNAIHEGDTRPDDSGMTPSQQLEAVSERANTMLRDLHTLVWDSLVPSLAEEGILIRRLADLSAAEHAAVSAYFKSDVLAALTPLAIDMERPFPMLSSLSLNLAFWLRPADGGDQHRLAVVQVPAGLSRLVRVSGTPSPTFVLLDKVICAENASLFPGQSVVESVAFRLSRDAELLQAGQELFQMLAAEMAEDVLPRRVLAAPRDQPQDQGGHQRVVQSADRAIRGRVSHYDRRRGSPSTCRP